MKVCMLTSVHRAFDDRIFHKEARTLVRAGYEVFLVAPHERDEEVEGVRVLGVPRSRTRFKRMLRTPLQIFLRGLRIRAAIYHFHDPELLPVGLFLRVLGKKVIYDAHEYYKNKILSKDYIPKVLRGLTAGSFDLFESFASRFFDGVVVADEVVERKFNGRAVRVQNFPYLPENFGEVKKDQSRFAIVYTGGLSEEGGLFKMVEAMEFVQEPGRLVLVGRFASEAARKKAEAMRGYEKVEWLGFRPWQEALKIVASSHIGLALYQPIPAYLYAGENSIKLFEYMMFGLPVLVSNFPNLAAIVKKVRCGIAIDPTDPRAIAREINGLMRAPDLLRDMGERGKRAVAEKYNWEQAAKRLLALYATVGAGST